MGRLFEHTHTLTWAHDWWPQICKVPPWHLLILLCLWNSIFQVLIVMKFSLYFYCCFHFLIKHLNHFKLWILNYFPQQGSWTWEVANFLMCVHEVSAKTQWKFLSTVMWRHLAAGKQSLDNAYHFVCQSQAAYFLLEWHLFVSNQLGLDQFEFSGFCHISHAACVVYYFNA